MRPVKRFKNVLRDSQLGESSAVHAAVKFDQRITTRPNTIFTKSCDFEEYDFCNVDLTIITLHSDEIRNLAILAISSFASCDF